MFLDFQSRLIDHRPRIASPLAPRAFLFIPLPAPRETVSNRDEILVSDNAKLYLQSSVTRRVCLIEFHHLLRPGFLACSGIYCPRIDLLRAPVYFSRVLLASPVRRSQICARSKARLNLKRLGSIDRIGNTISLEFAPRLESTFMESERLDTFNVVLLERSCRAGVLARDEAD